MQKSTRLQVDQPKRPRKTDELKFLQDKNLSLLLFLKIYKSLVFKSSYCCVFRKDMKSTFCVYSDLDNFLRHPGNMKGSNSSNKSAGFNSRHVFPLSQTSLSLMENDPPGIYGSCHSSDLQRSSSVIINYKGVKVLFLQNIKWLKKMFSTNRINYKVLLRIGWLSDCS